MAGTLLRLYPQQVGSHAVGRGLAASRSRGLALSRPRGRVVAWSRGLAEGAEGAERGPHLGHERLRLLERSEMAAFAELVPVPQVRVMPLGPAPRRPEDLFREDRAAHRHLHRAAHGPA